MKKTFKQLLAFAMMPVVLAGCAARTAETIPQTAAATAAAETSAPAPTVQETKTAETAETVPAAKEEVTIVYTNDVHSYIYNTITDKETKQTHPGLRLSSAAALKKELKNEGKNVLLVDAGDEIQGNMYGSYDKGESIINIMNAAGYDLAAPGNHEFDFGVANFFDRAGQAKYPFISCTFKNVSDNTTVLEPAKIFDFNGTRVAFIGVSTPETLTSTARTTFQDQDRNQIYTFSGHADVNEFYQDVQTAIDAVRDQADYIIGLGHVGVDASALQAGLSSKDLIAHTEGFDAFIDGHSHTSMEAEYPKDKSGSEVLLTQTGYYLSSIGVMTIASDGVISARLMKECADADAETAAVEDRYDALIQEQTSVKVGELPVSLCVNDPEKTDMRIVRFNETNLGDFITDAYYWYLKDVVNSPCDVVINNAGGIRTSLEKGDITYMNVKNVIPYGNTICQIRLTGAELKDVLENGVQRIGLWDPEWNQPAESGPFMHVAGIRFTVDASVPSSVVEEDGSFKEVSGEYRVKNLQVYNRETAQYEDVDPEGSYTVGGIDYLLRNGGSGLAFLQDNECVQAYVGPEAELVIEYIHAFQKTGEFSVITSANSPLASMKNYLMEYENPYGAGRINIINLKYEK